ncbi:MAG: ATP-binding protein [Prevotella sp.]|nr:ATP-binding protein [Prevotella sp.]MDY5665999.1 ATP-binding protein [Alloprevotella sp.]
MKRNVFEKLLEWKQKKNRKPLILNGARQVGKTYILRAFGEECYEKVAYINCDKNELLQKIFEQDYDIQRILLSLSALVHFNIEPENTLIIFDEIQESPVILNSLKYFCEEAPQYHVAVAGSLLGISLHNGMSFPVGKVDMIKMYPMTFDEFLLATGQTSLVEVLKQGDFSVIDALGLRFIDSLRQYYFVGGMPAAVRLFAETKDLVEVRNIQKQILFDYQRDFSKHAPSQKVPRINMVWETIPAQLAKENKKFIFGALKKGARASEFEMAIQWLKDAGLIYQVNRVTAPTMPLKFYAEMSVFKLFILDIGLMGAMVDTPAESILVADTLFKEYKGAFTELFVLTQLMPLQIPIYYFSSNDSRVEIDFIVQHGATITPIEVKAEENVHAKSLRTFINKHPELRGIRLSMKPYQDQEWMENKPLYAVNCWV